MRKLLATTAFAVSLTIASIASVNPAHSCEVYYSTLSGNTYKGYCTTHEAIAEADRKNEEKAKKAVIIGGVVLGAILLVGLVAVSKIDDKKSSFTYQPIADPTNNTVGLKINW